MDLRYEINSPFSKRYSLPSTPGFVVPIYSLLGVGPYSPQEIIFLQQIAYSNPGHFSVLARGTFRAHQDAAAADRTRAHLLNYRCLNSRFIIPGRFPRRKFPHVGALRGMRTVEISEL